MRSFTFTSVFISLFLSLAAHSQNAVEERIARLEEKAEYDSLIPLLEQSIHYSDASRSKKAAHLRKLVSVYIEKQDYVNATTASERLINWVEEADSLPAIVDAYGLKATAEYFLGNMPLALEYIEKSYRLRKQLKDTTGVLKELIRLAILHQGMGDAEQSLKWLRVAEEIPTEDNDLKSKINNSFSVAFADMNQHDSSLFYLRKSIEAKKKVTQLELEEKVRSFYNLAATYINLDDYATAIQYLDSTQLYEWEGIDTKLIDKILSDYYNSYFKLNDSENGHIYLQKYIAHHEQVFKEKMDTQIREFQVLYEKEKRFRGEQQEMKIKELSMQRWMLSLVAGGLVLVMAGGSYAYHNKRRKNKAENDKIKIEQRLLRTQMDPHFILNTLAGIQMQVEDDQKEKASNYLSSFGRLMQITLENSRENYILIESEIKALENYLLLQLMRFEDEFSYQIETSGLEEESSIYIPPMLIQPFVENAILHGIRGINRKGFIWIDIRLEGETIVCTIDDNGKGLMSSRPRIPNKQSLSTQIVRERLAILSSELKKRAELKIIDKSGKGEEGVKVIIIIPYRTSC